MPALAARVHPDQFPGLADTDRVVGEARCSAVLLTSPHRRPDTKPYQETPELPAVVYMFVRLESGHRVPVCRGCVRGASE